MAFLFRRPCMKKVLLTLFLLSFSFLFAQNIVVPKNHILVTEQGIFFDMDDILMQAQTISFMGNGLYEVTYGAKEYYGQCGRCGWALDQNGKCTNQNCNQYGPRERD